MLEQLARHSLIDITVKAKGDLHIDQHHTIEDVGIALGQAIRQALGDSAGIARYADVHLPMDEALTRCAIDMSGRPYLVWKVAFTRDKIGDFDTRAVPRVLPGASPRTPGSRCTSRRSTASNNHHIAETCFKALARALRAAVAIDPRQGGRVPSTKGSLTG